MGEGGALLLKDDTYVDNAIIIREKGTNRTLYNLGKVDKYSWIMPGSSYLPSDMNAAYLYAQLQLADEINNSRLDHWNRYYKALTPLKEKGLIELPYIPEECVHNAHMFYIKCKDFEERQGLINYLRSNDILPASHYVPLHSSKAGVKYSQFRGKDRYTTKESERLLRLPMYYKLTNEDLDEVVMRVKEYYKFT